MRNRHFPRLCDYCQAPMGAQQDSCWRCGETWASEPKAAVRLRLIEGGAAVAVQPVSTADRLARLVAEARA